MLMIHMSVLGGNQGSASISPSITSTPNSFKIFSEMAKVVKKFPPLWTNFVTSSAVHLIWRLSHRTFQIVNCIVDGLIVALTILDGILSLTSSILSSGLIDRISCEIGEELGSETIKIRFAAAKKVTRKKDGTSMADIAGFVQGH